MGLECRRVLPALYSNSIKIKFIMQNITLFKLIERIGARGWRGVLEHTRRIMGVLNRILICVSGGPSKGHCIALYAMSKRIYQISQRSGLLFTSIYLKQVGFHLQQYVGAERPLAHNQKVFISLTRSGIPRFIPPIYRKRLRGEIDPMIVKIVLSVCTLSRIIKILPKSKRQIDVSTIETEGSHLTSTIVETIDFMEDRAYAFYDRYCPSLHYHPLRLGYRFRPVLSAGPNTNFPVTRESYLSLLGLSKFSKLTAYHILTLDAGALMAWWNSEFIQTIGELFFPHRIFIPGDVIEEAGLSSSENEYTIWDYLFTMGKSIDIVYSDFIKRPFDLTKLAVKLEHAGKVRLFVMCSSVIQMLLYPLHDWSMGVLSTLKTDGTYNQTKPLLGLIGKKHLFSFDLKSATDLYPAEILRALVTSFFGKEFSRCWFALMTTSSINVPDSRYRPERPRRTYYRRGQPLGLYSSWSIFTMVHHLIVWVSAEAAYPGVDFHDYAILGDDLVIADIEVAKNYAIMLEASGGVLSKDKSLISDRGCCEFAKRFIMNNHLASRVDVSPLSMPLVRVLDRYSPPFVFSKLGVPDLKGAFRLKGAGYKVYSKLQANRDPYKVMGSLSRKWRRLMVSLHSPSGLYPLGIKLWLTYPAFTLLDCYQEGFAYDFLILQMKQPELDELSIREARLLWSDESERLFEFHIQSLIIMHLEYVVWYAKVSTWRDYPLSFLLSPPVAPKGLIRQTDRQQIHKYGYPYKLWDAMQVSSVKDLYKLAIGDSVEYRREAVCICLFSFKKLEGAVFLNDGW